MRCPTGVPSVVSGEPWAEPALSAYRPTMRSSSWVPLVLVGAAGLLTAQIAAAAPAHSTHAHRKTSSGQSQPDPAEGFLKITAAAGVRGTPRTVRGIQWQRPVVTSSPMSAAASSAVAPPAPDPWSRFVHQRGGAWQSAWDQATQTPVRVWGEGLPAPGTMASPELAEAFARQVLSDHLELWAPGTQASDFRLVSNHTDGDIRTLGFVQSYRGLSVVGGQMSFRFKRDRLVVIAAEAIPNLAVEVPSQRSRMSAAQLGAMGAKVGQELTALGLPAQAKVVAAGNAEPLILPIIGDRSVLGARVVVPFHVEGAAAGRWMLYADAETGATVGFESLTFYGQGKLLYRVAPRHPGAGRVNRPVNRMSVTVGGTPSMTTLDGTVTWPGELPQTLTPSVSGQLITMVNKAGMLASTSLILQPNGEAVWDASADPIADAQLNVAVHIGEVKEFVRTFAPAMPTLDAAITTNLNIDMECNASFDGKDLNFYRSSTRCQNTGLLADVVYHEFGHAMHFHSIIQGVGRLDGAFSEGLSDFLAVNITDDAGMGRGFFYGETPLRELDPPNREPRWPEDIGEIHKTGIIYGSAMWDLRKAFIMEKGRAVALPLINRLFYASVQRASDIPTTLVEILLADDNDGNLANGTPNECTILDVFGRHGLRMVSGVSDAPGAIEVEGAGTQEVSFTLLGRSPRCTSDLVTSFEVAWFAGPRGLPTPSKIQATRVGETERWTAQLPLPVFDAMKYTATVTFGSTIKVLLPDNLGDPMYSLYEGETLKLLCANMDANPLTQGWTATEGWGWGAAVASGTGDPHASYSGQSFLSMTPGADYEADAKYKLTLPTIDVGRYSDVRLQYRRWLTVEDSEFDQATIAVNDKVVWRNVSDNRGNDSSLHHLDREWRFHDVPLSSRFRGGELSLTFNLATDGGLEFGGWAIDDLCVVADPNAICGDGKLSGPEECDEGDDNADKPNQCRIDCKVAACGDGIVDRGEECDDGDPSDRCAVTCLLNQEESGCCSAGGGNPTTSLLLSLGVLSLVLRRRRSSRQEARA